MLESSKSTKVWIAKQKTVNIMVSYIEINPKSYFAFLNEYTRFTRIQFIEVFGEGGENIA